MAYDPQPKPAAKLPELLLADYVAMQRERDEARAALREAVEALARFAARFRVADDGAAVFRGTTLQAESVALMQAHRAFHRARAALRENGGQRVRIIAMPTTSLDPGRCWAAYSPERTRLARSYGATEDEAIEAFRAVLRENDE